MRLRGIIISALCAGLASAAFAASPIYVSNLNDSGPNSLRAAIVSANAAGTGDIRFSINGTITLLSPLPAFTANISITGPGTNLLTVSGNNAVRVFSMNPGTTNTLAGVTIANGMAQGTLGFSSTYASGISNAGYLKLTNCFIRNCTNMQSYGVGIYNAGVLEMQRSVVAECGAAGWQYVSTHGGGIYNEGSLRMDKCRITGCGAYYNAWAGGGILNLGTLDMRESVVDSCATGGMGDGGGIWSEGAIKMSGCVISNCVADFWGGAIASYGTLAMTNSMILDNEGFQLGGGLNLGGTNWLVGCTIAKNDCYGSGGGLFVYEGVLNLVNCTVSDNWASDYIGGGGGIAKGATAYGSRTDAAIYVNCCTIVSNIIATGSGLVGGGVWNGAGTFTCQNSILANNSPNDFSGVLTSGGYNLVQNMSDCTLQGDSTGNLYGGDPRLGSLQDNGGPTWTHALLLGSRAIDAGGGANLPATDQRNISRPQGLAPDIGAFEAQYTFPLLARTAVEGRTNCSIELCGLRGGSYTLQVSSNLVHWINAATNIAGTNGLCSFADRRWDKATPHFYRVSVPAPVGSIFLPAPSGIVSPPLLISNTCIFHSIDTNTPYGGRAEYPFVIAKAGSYVLQTSVNAPNDSANSFFVNIDAEPTDPYMIWDIPTGAGFASRTVSWRGTGTFDHNEFIPKVFNLTPGPHRLIIRGREANALLQSIAITPSP